MKGKGGEGKRERRVKSIEARGEACVNMYAVCKII